MLMYITYILFVKKYSEFVFLFCRRILKVYHLSYKVIFVLPSCKTRRAYLEQLESAYLSGREGLNNSLRARSVATVLER